MLLVIVGAGASYDSVPHFPPFRNDQPTYEWRESRPPLANQLFEDRPLFVKWLKYFPDCIPIVSRLRKTGISVEQELARLQAEAKKYPQRSKQLTSIQYYLHCCLWECQKQWSGRHEGFTNHAAFLDAIEHWRYEYEERVCFVTFNYDFLLEEALVAKRDVGFQISNIDGYISHPHYAVIKLHGSVNWGQQVTGISHLGNIPSVPRNPFDASDLSPQHMIDMYDRLTLADSYTLVNHYPVVRENHALVFPALAIPVQDKDKFVCPRNHVEHLRSMLHSTTKIVTVGWRATEAAFLELLQSELQRPVDLMVVSGDSEGVSETINNLTPSAVRGGRVSSVSTGFTGLVDELSRLEQFLRDFGRAANA